MSGRGRVVVDLTEESPPPASTNNIPDSRFITPSDDSDDSIHVVWDTRKKKSDPRTTGNHLKPQHGLERPTAPSHPSFDRKKIVSAQRHVTTNAPTSGANSAQPRRPLPEGPVIQSQRLSSQQRPSSQPQPQAQSQLQSQAQPQQRVPPHAQAQAQLQSQAQSHAIHRPVQQALNPPLRASYVSSRPPNVVPSNGPSKVNGHLGTHSHPNNPVSIVSPAFQQFLADSQAQRKANQTTALVRPATVPSAHLGHNLVASKPPSAQRFKPSNKTPSPLGRAPPTCPSSTGESPSYGTRQQDRTESPAGQTNWLSPRASGQQNKVPGSNRSNSMGVATSLLVPNPSLSAQNTSSTTTKDVIQGNLAKASTHIVSSSSFPRDATHSKHQMAEPAINCTSSTLPPTNLFSSAIQRSSSRDLVGISKHSAGSFKKRRREDTDEFQLPRKSRRPEATTVQASVGPVKQLDTTDRVESGIGSFDTPLPSVETSNPQPQFLFPDDVKKIRPFPHKFGVPFTDQEDALIQYLKDVKKIPWKDFEYYFPGRRWTSLQSRYSTNLSPAALARRGKTSVLAQASGAVAVAAAAAARSPANQQDSIPSNTSKETRIMRTHVVESNRTNEQAASQNEARCRRNAAPLTWLTRHRELGSTRGREWPRKFHAEIKDYAYSTFGAYAYIDNASGDVSTVAWSPDGNIFAAGAVAVTDPQSIQYNKPRNLMVGGSSALRLKELPEHKIMRSGVSGRQHELFSTVQLVGFSPESTHLYSVSIDQRLNVYKTSGSALATEFVQSFEHPASVDFLSVNKWNGRVATGCAYSGPGAVRVLDPVNHPSTSASFSGTNATSQTRKYPSALRWGEAYQHKDLLLAGFSCEVKRQYAEDDEIDKDGEICLWDASAECALEVSAPKRNVFDVAWNPNPSSASSIFAVASGVANKVNLGMHSVVRLYSPKDRTQAHSLIELECPAWDINDVLYSPHDDNIITIGSTEGVVYIWDLRYVKRGQEPLRTFQHYESIAVLPHGKRRWEADTGIRFLSWGEQRDRLYSGSSDGFVKCWDPYRSDEDKFVRDVVQLKSAVMSGAFSPDYSSLLIGEDQARLNLLTVGNEGTKFNQETKRFAVKEAVTEEESEERPLVNCDAMLANSELQVRPVGTMPFRQVVQGPNYDGPVSQDADAPKLRNEAQKFQERAVRMLHRRKKQLRKTTHIDKACSLDCGHRPLSQDDREENSRSANRIPDRLRADPGTSARSLGLLGKCSKCGGASRLGEDAQSSMLCERCDFACFRCGEAASISPRGRAIECRNCNAAWSVSALGYELIEKGRRARGAIKEQTTATSHSIEEKSDGILELGNSEREYFLQEAVVNDSDDESVLGAGL